MIDTRSAAEIYRDMMRAMRADVGFRDDLNPNGCSSQTMVYRGPRGEAGVCPIYRGQMAERQEDR